MGEREISHRRDFHPTSQLQLVRLHRNSRKLNGNSCADIVLLPSQGLPSAIVFVRIPQESAPELIFWKQVTCTGAFSCGIRTKTMQREALAPGWAAERYPHLPMLVFREFRVIRGCF